jgi:hypothetical protein
MEAIRQIVKVKNNKISITLPANFSAEEVEVIILSSQDENYSVPQWQMDQVRERSNQYHKNPEIELDFDAAMKEIENDLLKNTFTSCFSRYQRNKSIL